MASAPPGSESQHGDDQEASLYRTRYRELLEELRTIIPGVQVLLAFLLTAPFSARFSELDDLGMALYGVSVVSAAIATILLVAPASYHRLTRLDQEREVDRSRRLAYSGQVAVIGLGVLLVSIVSGLLLVTNFVFELPIGLVISSLVTALALVTWYAVPLLLRPKNP